jgi:hypothetical protein
MRALGLDFSSQRLPLLLRRRILAIVWMLVYAIGISGFAAGDPEVEPRPGTQPLAAALAASASADSALGAVVDSALGAAADSAVSQVTDSTLAAAADSLPAGGAAEADSLLATGGEAMAAQALGAAAEADSALAGEAGETPFTPPEVPYPRPFGIGEALTFSIQYGPVKAGTAVLAVEALEKVGDRECYRITSTARSNPVFSFFYKVKDRIVSLVDVRHLLTRRTTKDLHEKDYRLDQRIDWDQDEGVLSYQDGTVLDLDPGARDILGAMYYVRTLPLSVGSSIPMPTHDNKKSYPLTIDVIAEETIDTPLGHFDCWVVEPRLESAGLFRRSGSLKVWLTRDEERMPVMMQSAVKVGAISAILVDLQRGDRSLPGFGLNAN